MDTIVGPSPSFFRPIRAAAAPITVADVQDSGVCGVAPALSTGQLTTGLALVVGADVAGTVVVGIVVVGTGVLVPDANVAFETVSVWDEVGGAELPLEQATHISIATPSVSRIAPA